MQLFRQSRARVVWVVVLGVLVASGTVMITVAQDDGGDMVYACVDSSNGALYGVQIDVDNVRCSRGDDQIGWALGEPGPGGATGISFAGSWQQGTSYMEGVIVEHEGSSYVSIAEDPSSVEPPDENYWQLVALRGADGEDGDPGPQGPAGQDGEDGEDGDDGKDGEQGPAGPRGLTGEQGPFGLDGEGFAWKGDYASSTTYERNDVVHHQGSAWVAVEDDPASDPETGNGWELFARGFDEPDDNGDTGGGGEGNGTAAAAVHHNEEATIINSSNLQSGTATATCSESASRIVSGGYHLADGNGNYLTGFGDAYLDSLRGSGPEFDTTGQDSWRVSWGQLMSVSAGDVVVVHAYCVDELAD